MRKPKAMVLTSLVLFVGVVLAVSVLSEERKDSLDSSHMVVQAAGLKWTPMKLKGAALAVVSGDPTKAGALYVLRIRNIDGTKIPPHWHPEDENITVLQGTFLVGMGEQFDETKLQAMNAGDFTSIPKEMRHFAMAKGETIYQIHGIGPFKINWVNPADVAQSDKGQ
jgi:quercetin dioxygenase-like cupin family protein